jgi:hypothetical protein
MNRDWAVKPTPKEQILAKFWHQVDFSKTVSKTNAQKVLDQIEDLENVEDIGQIVKLLVA